MSADPPISEREREILRLVAEGATNQQIAQQLDISVNTVKVHLRNIFGKIGVASRTEATVYAIRQGLVVVHKRQGAPAAPADLPAVALEVPPPAVDVAPPPALDGAQPPAEPAPPPAAPDPPAATQGAARPGARPSLPLIAGAAAAVLTLIGIVALLVRPSPAPSAPPAVSGSSPVSEAERWRSRAALPTPRTGFAAAAHDGRLYVIGGGAAGTPSAAMDRYDPTNNVWVTLTEKPTAVANARAAPIGRTIYVPGGEAAGGQVLDILEAYDTRTQQWERLPPLPAPRSRYALVSLEGRLYLFGGWDGAAYRAEVFIFDPATRAWSEGDPLLSPRREAGAAVVEGRIYVVGGENERGPQRVNERYDPTADAGRRWESVAPPADSLARPAAVGTLNVALILDPDRRVALQYAPETDSWAQGAIPEDVPVSSQAVFLGTGVYVFGESDGALSEYRALFNTFLPGTTGE